MQGHTVIFNQSEFVSDLLRCIEEKWKEKSHLLSSFNVHISKLCDYFLWILQFNCRIIWCEFSDYFLWILPFNFRWTPDNKCVPHSSKRNSNIFREGNPLHERLCWGGGVGGLCGMYRGSKMTYQRRLLISISRSLWLIWSQVFKDLLFQHPYQHVQYDQPWKDFCLDFLL